MTTIRMKTPEMNVVAMKRLNDVFQVQLSINMFHYLKPVLEKNLIM